MLLLLCVIDLQAKRPPIRTMASYITVFYGDIAGPLGDCIGGRPWSMAQPAGVCAAGSLAADVTTNADHSTLPLVGNAIAHARGRCREPSSLTSAVAACSRALEPPHRLTPAALRPAQRPPLRAAGGTGRGRARRDGAARRTRRTGRRSSSGRPRPVSWAGP